MVFKLLVSLVLSVPAVAAVLAQSSDAPSVFGLGLVVVVLGYHRNLLERGDTPPWGRVVLPTEESMRVRYTIWGVPLAPARRVRHGVRLQRRAAASPWRARTLESLPALLRWLLRKAGA